jgi:hypothetical protein
MTAREFTLKRFALASAQRRGGVSSAQIFGIAGTRKFAQVELEAALKELRDEGVLAFTSGLWWKRSARAS